jgi:hypothetical protein
MLNTLSNVKLNLNHPGTKERLPNEKIVNAMGIQNRLCGLVVLATDPDARVLFPAVPDFVRKSEKRKRSGTGSTQSREYN